jgi:hypothetical protein
MRRLLWYFGYCDLVWIYFRYESGSFRRGPYLRILKCDEAENKYATADWHYWYWQLNSDGTVHELSALPEMDTTYVLDIGSWHTYSPGNKPKSQQVQSVKWRWCKGRTK